MSSSKKEKSPYKRHSIEEVMAAENGNYYIQIGDTMFESDTGKLAFNKERAEMFYDNILAGLIDMKKNGTYEEKEEATFCQLNLRIIPLRFH